MYDLIVLYAVPEDVEAFDHHYTNIHIKLVEALPFLKAFSWGKVEDAHEAGFYLVARLTFASAGDAQDAMASEAGQVSVKDLENFAQAGVRVLNVPRAGGFE